MVMILRSALAAAVLALGLPSINVARAEDLCSITPTSYATAKTDYPELAFALKTVEQYSIAAWYTDRLSTTDRAKMLDDLTTQCSEASRMTIVVYGIPNKDCNAGYSSGGTVSNTADYKKFLSDLTTAVGSRKVLYVVEPDALGLLAEDGGCGSSAGYLDNLKVAVEALSANANAELYVDVGYWTLQYEAQRSKVVTIMKELATSGTLKGVTINTSNYRTTEQVSELCSNFQTAMGSKGMSCIVDTSRNYNTPSSTDWCNVLEAGIGHPPTSETNITNLDYFMWVKPPGESDGTCSGGPSAGAFFETGFKNLWDQGYFVKALGMNTIAQGGSDTTSSQTTSSQTKDDSASKTTAPQKTGASSSEETDSSASQTTQTTSSPATDDSASQTTQTTGSTGAEADTTSSLSDTTAQSDTSSQSDAPSSPSDTTSSQADTTSSQSDAASSPSDTTSSQSDATSSQSDTTSSQSDTTVPTSTTATPMETTATPIETEAPTQAASNCKVKRRLRKF